MAIPATTYKHKLILQERASWLDEMGGEVERWQNGPVIHGRVEVYRGSEQFERQQVQARVEARIKIRFRKDLDPANHRIKHGPTVYNILSVLPDAAHKETHLLCVARSVEQGEGEAVNP